MSLLFKFYTKEWIKKFRLGNKDINLQNTETLFIKYSIRLILLEYFMYDPNIRNKIIEEKARISRYNDEFVKIHPLAMQDKDHLNIISLTNMPDVLNCIKFLQKYQAVFKIISYLIGATLVSKGSRSTPALQVRVRFLLMGKHRNYDYKPNPVLNINSTVNFTICSSVLGRIMINFLWTSKGIFLVRQIGCLFFELVFSSINLLQFHFQTINQNYNP